MTQQRGLAQTRSGFDDMLAAQGFKQRMGVFWRMVRMGFGHQLAVLEITGFIKIA